MARRRARSASRSGACGARRAIRQTVAPASVGGRPGGILFDLRRAWLRGRVGGTPPDWSSARRRGQVGHPGRPGNARGSGPQDPTRAGDREGSRLAFDHGLEAAGRAGSPDRTATARATRRYLPVGPPDPRTVHRSVVATPAGSARRTPVPVAYQSPGWRAPNSTRERRRSLQLTLGVRLRTPDRAGLAGPPRPCSVAATGGHGARHAAHRHPEPTGPLPATSTHRAR